MAFGLQEKIIGSIFLVSMAVSVVLSVVFYNNSVEVIENNYVSSVTNNLSVCAGMFDDAMKDAYYIAINAASDDAIQDSVQAYHPSEEQQLLDLLNGYRSSGIDSIYCYLPEANLLLKATQSETVAQDCSETDLDWLKRVTGPQENPLSPPI